MSAITEIVEKLVEQYDRHKEFYCSGQYNESQVCDEFITPLFEALGWDISNKLRVSPIDMEVIQQYSIKNERKNPQNTSP